MSTRLRSNHALRSHHAGLMRERVALQRNTPTEDNTGAEVPSWADFDTVWARVQAAPGSERVADNREVAVARHLITIRWRTDITPADRVVWQASGGNRTLAIDDMGDPDDMRQWLQLSCYEVVGEAQIG